MQYRNERAQNNKIEVGNILKAFEEMRNLINVNDGTRSFTYRTVDCHDQSAPFQAGQYSQINLTHPDHFISDVDKGFITAHVKQTLKLNTDSKWKQNVHDFANLIKLFNGLKDSNQIFDRLEILHNNVNVGYQQNESVREGFLYGAQKPEAEKKRRRFVHTLWENISAYSQTMCGGYVNLNDFRATNTTTQEYDINIPFDDILALQAFDLFPNGLIGDLSIRFQVTGDGQVWAVLDPHVVAEVKGFLEEDPFITGDLLNITQQISSISKLKKRFTQIGNDAVIPSKFLLKVHVDGKYTDNDDDSVEQTLNDDYELTTDFFNDLQISPTLDIETIVKKKHSDLKKIVSLNPRWSFEYETQPATLTYSGFEVTLMKSNMQGYGCCQATKDGITEILREGIIIPSQQVDYHAFPLPATANGIKSNLNIPLMNVTTMTLMFPKHANDLTVFENPMYQDCYLNIAGTNYPDENVDTVGARFFESQLTCADLDSLSLQCTKEFEDSMTMIRNHEISGKRFANTLSDATSFLFQIQTERANAGYTFDGLDSNFGNVQIQVNGQPIYKGADDTYYNVDESGTIHPPPIQLWLTRDTYFTLDLNGLVYHDKTTPEGSQADQPRLTKDVVGPRREIVYGGL